MPKRIPQDSSEYQDGRAPIYDKARSSYARNLERLIERIQSVCSGDDPSDYELKEVYDLACVGCGRVEIAKLMGYDFRTCWKNPSIIKAFELGEACVSIRLRRACMTHALRGNTQVLLWMARNYLPDLVQDPNKPAQHLHLHAQDGRVPMDLEAIKKEMERLGLPPPSGDDILELDAPVIDTEAVRDEVIDRTDRGLAKAKEALLDQRKRSKSCAKKSEYRDPPSNLPVMTLDDYDDNKRLDSLEIELSGNLGMDIDEGSSGE